MTDLAAQLRAVEEAAEKARKRAEYLLTITRAPEPNEQSYIDAIKRTAADVLSFTDLPFRAVREELQALREALAHYADVEHWSPESGRIYTTFTYDGGHAEPWHVARAVLCPDPAGGER